MKEVAKAPPAAYWNNIRESEEVIFGRAHEFSPYLYGDSAVEVWSSGSADGVDIFDTVAYRSLVPVRSWRPRTTTLTTYDKKLPPEEKRTMLGEARFFDIKLEPKRESLVVYAAFLPLAWHGLVPDSMRAMQRGRALYDRCNLLTPTDDDYAFVQEQFSRGASGAFTIQHPSQSDL